MLEEFTHAPQPEFIIRGLRLDTPYLLTVTAANARGSATPVTIPYTAHSDLEPHKVQHF